MQEKEQHYDLFLPFSHTMHEPSPIQEQTEKEDASDEDDSYGIDKIRPISLNLALCSFKEKPSDGDSVSLYTQDHELPLCPASERVEINLVKDEVSKIKLPLHDDKSKPISMDKKLENDSLRSELVQFSNITTLGSYSQVTSSHIHTEHSHSSETRTTTATDRSVSSERSESKVIVDDIPKLHLQLADKGRKELVGVKVEDHTSQVDSYKYHEESSRETEKSHVKHSILGETSKEESSKVEHSSNLPSSEHMSYSSTSQSEVHKQYAVTDAHSSVYETSTSTANSDKTEKSNVKHSNQVGISETEKVHCEYKTQSITSIKAQAYIDHNLPLDISDEAVVHSTLSETSTSAESISQSSQTVSSQTQQMSHSSTSGPGFSSTVFTSHSTSSRTTKHVTTKHITKTFRTVSTLSSTGEHTDNINDKRKSHSGFPSSDDVGKDEMTLVMESRKGSKGTIETWEIIPEEMSEDSDNLQTEIGLTSSIDEKLESEISKQRKQSATRPRLSSISEEGNRGESDTGVTKCDSKPGVKSHDDIAMVFSHSFLSEDRSTVEQGVTLSASVDTCETADDTDLVTVMRSLTPDITPLTKAQSIPGINRGVVAVSSMESFELPSQEAERREDSTEHSTQVIASRMNLLL